MVNRLSLSVVIPTYRRPEQLAICLDAMAAQTEPADEIVVVHRRDDLDTIALLRERYQSVRATEVDRPGLIAALDAGIASATGDAVAITDDDAAPHADWCARLRGHFADPAVGAIGGRDLLSIDGRRVLGHARTVGVVRRWGRVVGNHEIGFGAARDVDHLKGVNMAVRADLFRLPDGLRGEGAQVYNELAVCLSVQDAGHRVRYDPDLLVDHTWGQRFDDDRRGEPAMAARANAVFNQSYILFSQRPRRRFARLTYVVLIGDRGNGGAARCLAARLTGDHELDGVFRPYLRAHLEAWRAARTRPLRMVTPGKPPAAI